MSLAFLRPFSPRPLPNFPLSIVSVTSPIDLLLPRSLAIVYRCHVASLRTPRGVFLFIRVNEVESRRSIEGTTMNEHLSKFYQPPFEYAILFLLPRYILFIYFRNAFTFLSWNKSIWTRARKYIENISILTISSKPLIPNEIWYGNQAWKRPYRVSGVRADHHDPFDAPFVCGNRTRRERWNSVQVRGGQQNEFPVWRPDNLGCAVPRTSSCQSGLMVSRWNARCLSDSSTDIYEVRTRHDIRSIHAIYLIVFPFTATALWSGSCSAYRCLDVALPIVPLY